jgi:hypothetical protein
VRRGSADSAEVQVEWHNQQNRLRGESLEVRRAPSRRLDARSNRWLYMRTGAAVAWRPLCDDPPAADVHRATRAAGTRDIASVAQVTFSYWDGSGHRRSIVVSDNSAPLQRAQWPAPHDGATAAAYVGSAGRSP